MSTIKPIQATPELNGKDAMKLSNQMNIAPTEKAIKKNTNVNVNLNTSFVGNLWTNTTMFDVNINQNVELSTIVNDLNLDNNKKKSRRILIYHFVHDCLNDYITIDDVNAHYDFSNNADWIDLTDSIVSKQGLIKTESSQLGGLVDKLTLGITNFAQSGFNNDPFKVGFAGKLLNAHGIAGPRSVWGLQQEGQILVSNMDGHTLKISDAGNAWDFYYPNYFDDAVITSIKNKLNI